MTLVAPIRKWHIKTQINPNGQYWNFSCSIVVFVTTRVVRECKPSSKPSACALESPDYNDGVLHCWSVRLNLPPCPLFGIQWTCSPTRFGTTIGHFSCISIGILSQGVFSGYFSHSFHTMSMVVDEVSVGGGSIDGLNVWHSRQSFGVFEPSFLAQKSRLDPYCRYYMVSHYRLGCGDDRRLTLTVG